MNWLCEHLISIKPLKESGKFPKVKKYWLFQLSFVIKLILIMKISWDNKKEKL